MTASGQRGVTTDRWRRVEALYHEMLARPANDRAAALVAACNGDDELAAEVQALLDQPESAAGPLAEPAVELAARLVSPMGASLIGRRIGAFEVQALLGVGGMGEVYRARDTRLGRTVAIKILPRAFTSDPDRLARFEREARVLASLNHSNIGTLYGLEEVDGVRALVLEFVEGQPLNERIGSSGLPVREALAIAAQIADALDAAHEKGIVHRDLKPPNIMITPTGGVKVLDFGLAKAGGSDAGAQDLSKSPTATREGTREGVILGTAAYMSPEQARGRVVDKRTDIWAFGCVLYEMLTGRAAFARETFSDTSAAILEHEADWSRLPRATPPVVARLLHRCLEKDARRRLRDIADARADLEELKADAVGEGAEGPVREPPRPTPRRGLAVAAALVLVGAVAFGVWFRRSTGFAGDTGTRARIAFTLSLPEGSVLADSYPSVSISRDGSLLALVARKQGVQSLYLRGLDALEWKELPGTDEAMSPFFSPDREWLAYFVPGKLMRVSLSGGAPQLVCEVAGMAGYVKPNGVWGEDGRILFSYWPLPEIWTVPASGGSATRTEGLGPRDPQTVWYRRPNMLPGGRGLLFSTSSPGWARVEILLPGGSGERRVLMQSATDGILTSTGHLVYGWNRNAWSGQILAVPFDFETMSPRGVPVPVMEEVRTFGGPPSATDFSLSENGTLVYASAPKTPKRLVWADRSGKMIPLPFPPRTYRFPALSPDGKRVAVTVSEGPSSDIWLGDLGRGNLSRLTLNQGSIFSLWSPDGKYVVFSNGASGRYNVFRHAVDTAGADERLTQSPDHQRATGFSPDGRLLFFHDVDLTTAPNLWVLSMADRKPALLVQTKAYERIGTLSPDGRWLAYDSNESGRFEVYVQPWPGLGERRQVSTDGGGNPMWNPRGHELFYTNEDRFMSVFIQATGGLQVGTPRRLFQSPMVMGEGPGRREYDVTPDGARFLFVEETAPPQLNVVVNWFEDLKRRVPITGPPLR